MAWRHRRVARRRWNHISVATMSANLAAVDGHINAIRRWRNAYNSAAQISRFAAALVDRISHSSSRCRI